MIILTLRTDKPLSEIGIYQNKEQLAYKTWEAHRQLAETLHQQIDEVLSSKSKSLQDVEAIVCYKGPGSFTGLRIGLSVANALSYANQIPIVGIEGEESWIEKGLDLLLDGSNHKQVVPAYGAAPHITQSKK